MGSLHAVLVSAILLGSASWCESGVMDPPGAIIFADVGTEYAINGWKCTQNTSCGGSMLLDSNGNYLGCEVQTDGGFGCSGACFTCQPDVPHQMNVCVSNSSYTCANPGGGTLMITCGMRMAHANGCTPTRPNGVPQTQNGCYCDWTVPSQAQSQVCEVNECAL